MRPQLSSIAARRRLLLLLVMALATLGIWSGGHCADPHQADPHQAAHAADVIAADASLDPSAAQGGAEELFAGHQQPSVSDDHCEVTGSHAVAAAPTSVAVTPQVRAYGRISPQIASRPSQPAPAGVTLSAIGVSRI